MTYDEASEVMEIARVKKIPAKLERFYSFQDMTAKPQAIYEQDYHVVINGFSIHEQNSAKRYIGVLI